MFIPKSLLLLTVVAALAGCGQKGPLYLDLPDEQLATQRGDEVPEPPRVLLPEADPQSQNTPTPPTE
ncbi:MAG: lipoprotein [Marinobacter sp.]|nr:lipoprotein [Marinobacter sp.]